MANVTIGLGIVLLALGLGSYFGSGRTSVTALIPAFFGLPLLALGWLALKENVRKHAMRAAFAISLLGCVGTVRGLAKLPRLLTGGEVERPTAVAIQSAMSVLCGVFVLLCVRSFIKARRGDASASPSMK